MEIFHEDILIPPINQSLTGFRPERCYGGTQQLYALNRQKTGLNRKNQKEFFNVIDEPKLNNALNGNNDAPILDWILVPILHIVCLFKFYLYNLLKIFVYVSVFELNCLKWVYTK